jgi:2-dehydropantoate 2-reductase
MRIAVMGTGAVGGYFGGRLAAAGQDVHFIARGRQLEALQANGLKLDSANGDLHLPSVSATDDPSTVGPVDTVLFTVKRYDTEPAAELARVLVGPDTTVITVQNGMDAEDRLRTIFGADRVMEGAAYIANAAVVQPGVISHAGPLARLVFGERDGTRSARAERFLAACVDAGIAAELSERIATELWAKFALLATFSGVSTVTRMPIGPIRGEPVTRTLMVDGLNEAVAVARARGVELGADYVAGQMEMGDQIPGETKASMLIDLERGKRLELEWMSGALTRLGRESGVRTPVHSVIYAALKLHANGTNATA